MRCSKCKEMSLFRAVSGGVVCKKCGQFQTVNELETEFKNRTPEDRFENDKF